MSLPIYRWAMFAPRSVYMSLYHVVYLVGTVTRHTAGFPVQRNAGLCGYHWCNDALCQRQGKDPVDPVIRPHPMFLTKKMFCLIEWFISLLTEIYVSWKSISFWIMSEESQTWRLDVYVSVCVYIYIYSTYRHDLTKLFNKCRLLAPDPLQVWALVVMKRWREAVPGHQNWLHL